jgi:hypothetical protein
VVGGRIEHEITDDQTLAEPLGDRVHRLEHALEPLGFGGALAQVASAPVRGDRDLALPGGHGGDDPGDFGEFFEEFLIFDLEELDPEGVVGADLAIFHQVGEKLEHHIGEEQLLVLDVHRDAPPLGLLQHPLEESAPLVGAGPPGGGELVQRAEDFLVTVEDRLVLGAGASEILAGIGDQVDEVVAVEDEGVVLLADHEVQALDDPIVIPCIEAMQFQRPYRVIMSFSHPHHPFLTIASIP